MPPLTSSHGSSLGRHPQHQSGTADPRFSRSHPGICLSACPSRCERVTNSPTPPSPQLPRRLLHATPVQHSGTELTVLAALTGCAAHLHSMMTCTPTERVSLVLVCKQRLNTIMALWLTSLQKNLRGKEGWSHSCFDHRSQCTADVWLWCVPGKQYGCDPAEGAALASPHAAPHSVAHTPQLPIRTACMHHSNKPRQWAPITKGGTTNTGSVCGTSRASCSLPDTTCVLPPTHNRCTCRIDDNVGERGERLTDGNA